MLEKLLLPANHAISILMKDHDKVKDLFDKFESAGSTAEKERIIREAVTELKIHAVIEEEIFYPAVRKAVGSDIMNEADEEHHVARLLIAELDRDGRGNDHRNAKFTVLAESVRHHIKEEEGEMLPKSKQMDIDFEALGRRMLQRKRELKANGIPMDAEHRMMSHTHASDDTPAMAARRPRSSMRTSATRTRSTQSSSRRGKGRTTSSARKTPTR
jgi:hypothetical protein